MMNEKTIHFVRIISELENQKNIAQANPEIKNSADQPHDPMLRRDKSIHQLIYLVDSSAEDEKHGFKDLAINYKHKVKFVVDNINLEVNLAEWAAKVNSVELMKKILINYQDVGSLEGIINAILVSVCHRSDAVLEWLLLVGMHHNFTIADLEYDYYDRFNEARVLTLSALANLNDKKLSESCKMVFALFNLNKARAVEANDILKFQLFFSKAVVNHPIFVCHYFAYIIEEINKQQINESDYPHLLYYISMLAQTLKNPIGINAVVYHEFQETVLFQLMGYNVAPQRKNALFNTLDDLRNYIMPWVVGATFEPTFKKLSCKKPTVDEQKGEPVSPQPGSEQSLQVVQIQKDAVVESQQQSSPPAVNSSSVATIGLFNDKVVEIGQGSLDDDEQVQQLRKSQ